MQKLKPLGNIVKHHIKEFYPSFGLEHEMRKKTVIRTTTQLKALADKMKDLEEFAFDTETNTLQVNADNPEFKLVGMSISWGEYNNYYIPTGHIFDDQQVKVGMLSMIMKPIFENPNIRIVAQNAKFDLHVLARINIWVKTLDIFDTMIASWICDENTPNGLKENTRDILGIDQTKIKDVMETVTKEEKKSVGLKANSKATFDLTRIDVASDYAIADAYYTWKLYLYYLDRLEAEGMETIFYRMYPRYLYLTFKMEERGIDLDVEKCKQNDEAIARDIEDLEYEMLELIGVDMNISSGQQLAQLLFGYDNFKSVNDELLAINFGFKPYSYTAKGVPQTNAETIKKIARSEFKNKHKMVGVKFCQLLMEYNKLVKLRGFTQNFLKLMYPDGKIHCNLNIIGTDSGRASSSNPNMQQIPNASEEDKYQMRSLFIGAMNEETGKRDSIISAD